MAAFTVNQHALVVSQVPKNVRLDLMFFGFLVVAVASAPAVTPGALDDLAFAEKIRALHGIRLICGAEDHPITQV